MHLKYPARYLGSESAKYVSGCYAFSSMLPCSAQRQEGEGLCLTPRRRVEARLRGKGTWLRAEGKGPGMLTWLLKLLKQFILS